MSSRRRRRMAPVEAEPPVVYRALGGEGASLAAALTYSNVVFAGNVLLWVMLALGLFLYGAGVLTSVVSGTWFAGERPRRSIVPAQRLDAATRSGGAP